MAIMVQCECGRRGKARDEFAGRRAQCPSCGRAIQVPELSAATAEEPQPAAAASPPVGGSPAPLEITEFLDPPGKPIEKKGRQFSTKVMLEALLDPRSIQWMLTLGAGLAVLGLIIWVTSKGIFEDPRVLAAAMGIGTAAILGAGWWVELKTRFHMAGQALTFLGCVVAPLNLWFYHAQGLVTLDAHLWIGGVVCCLLYAATVFWLRDPLFMYAVEAGITLTVVLFLAELGLASDPIFLSLALVALGLVSIHTERAFVPAEDAVFNRRRFGLPLFWSGQGQIGASLVILLAVQIINWVGSLGIRPASLANWAALGEEYWILAGGLWLAGTYAYLYSDLVVRRVGIYTYLAAFCLILTEITIVGKHLQGEGLIAVLAVTALAANVVQGILSAPSNRISRAVPPLALTLSAIPVCIGVAMHFRATSTVAADHGWSCETGWWFVAVMVLVAARNRLSAFLSRKVSARQTGAHFFFSAAAAIVAAAGLLRQMDLTTWPQQAPLLMLIPIAYLVASRLWRGHTPEQPLSAVARAATAVILLGALGSALDVAESMIRPVEQNVTNLLLGLVFAEAAVLFSLAAVFRRRSFNVYYAAAAAAAGLWQLLGFWGVHGVYYTLLYAVLGMGFLVGGRVLGLEAVDVYGSEGQRGRALRGRGLAAFQSGNAILLIALLAALVQGLMRLAAMRAASPEDWLGLGALALTTLAAAVAIGLAPRGGWRRLYVVAAIALAGLTFLTLNVLSHLSAWEKLEIFSVVVGTLMVGASYVGRFREADQRNEMVSAGLFLGSLLTTVPLLVAVIYYRFPDGTVSPINELALVALTVLMLVTGFGWQVRSTTLFGGAALTLYLVLVLVALGREAQLAAGVYLGVAGVLVFAAGIALSIYREKLIALPDKIARREGIFRVIGWR